jgi:hypothetical protein
LTGGAPQASAGARLVNQLLGFCRYDGSAMQPHLPRFLPYAVLAGSLGLTAMASLAPRPGQPVAAFFPPWWASARAFDAAARSGGEIVRVGALSTILVMMPNRTDPMPQDLARRLHEFGALLLIDAQALGACAGTF